MMKEIVGMVIISLVLATSTVVGEDEIFVTDGPVTSIEASSITLHGVMVIKLDQETLLYNHRGRKIPIEKLEREQFVTVILVERGKDLIAKEIYIHSKDGEIRLSRQGRRYFKKAGILVDEGPELLGLPSSMREELESMGTKEPPKIVH
jgi:hypothetical protein